MGSERGRWVAREREIERHDICKYVVNIFTNFNV
jgi:hypothetical protein